MRNFITLTSVSTEQNTYVQPDAITSIERYKKDEVICFPEYTSVRTKDSSFNVTEMPDEIMKLIKEGLDSHR